MLTAIWDILLELSPWLFLGAAVAGLMHILLPDGFIHKQLSGTSGVFKAVGLGVPLPLCSCGVIPAAVGLKKDGASDGSAVAFLISTPQTGVDSILVSAAFFGWPFALFKMGAAALTGITGGLLTERVSPTQITAHHHHHHHPSHDTRPKWRRALDHGNELIESIWGWLVFGVILSAALTTYLPANAFASTALSNGVLAGLLVLVMSLPLYVCATASVPIAASLLHAGFPPSAALVFLMAGPASNVATLGAVKSAFGNRILGIYLGTVALGSLGLGLLFDALLPTNITLAEHSEHGGLVATVSAVAMLILLTFYAITDAQAWLRKQRSGSVASRTLQVEGMTCGGCAKRLDKAIRTLDGMENVVVDAAEGTLVIEGSTPLVTVRKQVQEAGFTPVF